MIIIGIDPGLTGAVAVLCGRRGLLAVRDLPVTGNGTASGSMRNWLDVRSLSELLRGLRVDLILSLESVRAVIERPIPMPSLPAQTIASQFDTFGAIRGCVASSIDPDPLVVGPREWQKPFGLGKGDKAASRETARRLYPDAPVTLAKHHNRAEAILIAHYGLQELA